MQITIIGMHRSGTSLVAGLLGLAGAYLGSDDDLMAANTSNPKGYWENLGFVRFNERILEHFGGAWLDPPALPVGWMEDPVLIGWRSEAADFVAREFSGHALWAWKEPRTTLLLPFWHSVVPGARPIICVRNPLDVAGSLAKRDSFLFEHSMALWHLHMLCAVHDTDFEKACIAHYEEVLTNPRSALPPILDAGVDRKVVEQRWPQMQAFIDAGLEHHHHTADDLLGHPRVLEATKRLYSALIARDSRMIAEAVAEGDVLGEHLREIAHFHREYIDLQADMARVACELDVAKQQLGETGAQLAVKAQALEETQATLNTRLHRLAAGLSEKANRLPAATHLMRKMWR